MMGEHMPVASTNLASVAYDPETKDLEVLFTNGNRYRYAGVAPHHVENLKSAPSAGGYFHRAIRDAHSATKVK